MKINHNFDLYYDCKTEEDVKDELDRLWYTTKEYSRLRSMCEEYKLNQVLRQHINYCEGVKKHSNTSL